MLQTSPYTPLKCPMALATFWYLGRETPQRTRAVEPKGPSLLRDVAQKYGAVIKKRLKIAVHENRTKFAKCGGLRAIIGDFSAAKLDGDC
jgi:hypothetical protein